jgi:hypothetical protein
MVQAAKKSGGGGGCADSADKWVAYATLKNAGTGFSAGSSWCVDSTGASLEVQNPQALSCQ